MHLRSKSKQKQSFTERQTDSLYQGGDPNVLLRELSVEGREGAVCGRKRELSVRGERDLTVEGLREFSVEGRGRSLWREELDLCGAGRKLSV